MSFMQFDRNKLKIKSLSERKNRVNIEKESISPDQEVQNKSKEFEQIVAEAVQKIRQAHNENSPVMLAMGAHAIKNGLGPLLINLMEEGWLTHLATNGAGIIHDWEFAFQGQSSEDVQVNVAKGEFGIWQETGFYINLALIIGAFEGLGYGESVGAMIQKEGLQIPAIDDLLQAVSNDAGENSEKMAAALDLLSTLKRLNIKPGWYSIPHRYKKYSVQAAACRLEMPFTGHPMIGHDIIYTHPLNHGAAVGRTALRDFLTFAATVNRIEGGVYLSIGSAVMSPMIFEKSLSMAQNIHIQKGKHIDNYHSVIVDLAQSTWDWQSDGEPPTDNPAYYLRFCKTFSRMGGTMRYLSADNRDFLLALWQKLKSETP
jgi:hypothetical protein